MSEDNIVKIINTLITAMGSIIGGFITARATIIAAKMKAKENHTPLISDKKVMSWNIIFIGALIGAVLTIGILFLLGRFSLGEGNPSTVTGTKESPTSTISNSVSKPIETITIPSNLASGIHYEAPNTGIYTFKYTDSAFTAYGGCWSTKILAYAGLTPLLNNNNELDEAHNLFVLGSANCASTKQEAIEQKKGETISVRLNNGDTITLVVGDSSFSDNVGEIILEVQFSSN